MAATTNGTMSTEQMQNGQQASTATATWNYHISLPATDALPYYDDEIDRVGMRAKVEREIAAEMKKGDVSQVTEDRLPASIDLFQGRKDMQEQLDRVSQGRPMAALDKERYGLHGPADGEQASEKAWSSALLNAEAQLMHSDVRLTNLELLKKFGANQWRLHNFQQEAFVRLFDGATSKMQAETTSLNRARKQAQTEAGQELTRLNKRWAELLNRSLSVELANVVAQGETEDLEARRDKLRKHLDTLNQQSTEA